MSALDFVVLIGSMLGIAIYGIWRTRGRRELNTYLKGDSKTRVVCHWSFRHGHSSQCHHLSIDARAGVSRRTWIRANLFWNADCADHHCRRFPADFPTVECLYRLRISWMAFR